MCRSAKAWGLMWQSKNRLDGKVCHLIHENCLPILFRTRGQAREYANKHYGYIKHRPDLRAEPYGWRVPVPVRVTIDANHP